MKSFKAIIIAAIFAAAAAANEPVASPAAANVERELAEYEKRHLQDQGTPATSSPTPDINRPSTPPPGGSYSYSSVSMSYGGKGGKSGGGKGGKSGGGSGKGGKSGSNYSYSASTSNDYNYGSSKSGKGGKSSSGGSGKGGKSGSGGSGKGGKSGSKGGKSDGSYSYSASMSYRGSDSNDVDDDFVDDDLQKGGFYSV